MDERIVPSDAEFWTRARRHLLKYGGEFVDFVPIARFSTMMLAGAYWTSPRAR